MSILSIIALSLDPLGHHALTCKYTGDVVSRHNRLRDAFLSFVNKRVLVAKLGLLRHDARHTRLADILASNWVLGKPAALIFLSQHCSLQSH